MSTFNFTRFCQALKCQFMTSYKDWMVVFAIYIFALTFINVFSVRVSVFDGLSYAEAIERYGEAYMMEAYPLLIKGVAIFDIMFFGIAMLFCSSFFLSHLKKTPWRSAYFMWPVSNLEKFIISLLLYVVLSGICTVVCMMIADALRVLIDVATGRVIFWAVPIIFDPKTLNLGDGPHILLSFSEMLLIQSAYILGAALFNRQKFILTSFFVISLGYTMIKGNHYFYTAEGAQSLGMWICIVMYLISAMAAYWSAYKRFCRMQVINNKWLNV